MAGKPLKKPHILKIKLRTKAASNKKKKSQNTKKYIVVVLEYPTMSRINSQRTRLRVERGHCASFEVVQGRCIAATGKEGRTEVSRGEVENSIARCGRY